MGVVKVTLASTNGLEDQSSQLQPATQLLKTNNASQLKSAGTLSTTDAQLLKNQAGQLERKANHAQRWCPSGKSETNFRASLVDAYIRQQLLQPRKQQ